MSPKSLTDPGHFNAEMFDPRINAYAENRDLRIEISVDEQFDQHHRLVRQTASTAGKFSFTAADSGDHKICFTPSQAHAGGWLSGGQVLGTIKMTLDLAIGETSAIESDDKGKIQDIASKVKDLKGRLEDIKREQIFQRVSSRCCGRSGDWEMRGSWLIACCYRNGRLSSGISRRLLMPEWSGGRWFSSWFWALRARGSFRI